MGRGKVSIVFLFTSVLGLYGQVFGCPAVMTIVVDPNTTVNVGQTVIFTAVCDSTIQDYEWIFPAQAYSFSGQGTSEASCKFSPASDVLGYAVKLRYKFAGNWYGPASVTINVNAVSGPWYVRPDGDDTQDGRSWNAAFQTVQTGIHSASDGDELIVEEGVYTEHISFKGKDITVRSTDPNNWSVTENTILQGEGRGTVVFFEGTESADCLLKGFTVTEGGMAEEDPLGEYLEGYWELDETSGTEAPDSSGNGRTGTLIGFENPEESWVTGKNGNCLDFDGTNDHVKMTGYQGIGGGLSRTTCAWVRTSQLSGGILNYGKTVGSGRWLFILDGNGKLQLGISGGNIISTQVVADGQWHHVAAVLDTPVSYPAMVKDLRLYIDGRLAEGTYTNPNTEINTILEFPVRIGVLEGPLNTLGSYFNGRIDDVRIYDRALTEAEIRAIYSQGGGIFGNSTGAAVSHCIIRDNESVFDGGGIRGVEGDITDCFIVNNTSQTNGGGLADCDGLIANCVIAENDADGGGGLSNCTGDIVNCAIVSNTTLTGGILDDCNGTITNCILWNNTGILLADCNTPTYSCYPGASGDNNVNEDPNFRSLSDLKGPDRVWGTDDDGLILQGASPCMDTGSDPAVPASVTEDITGRNRFLDGDHDETATVDMGAYETPRIWYVDGDVTSSGDGKSWATAKKTIQEGINVSQDEDVVLVADGIYTGGGYTGPRNRDLDFEGKVITVRSINGPENCIIDSNGLPDEPHRGFYFHSGEGPDSVVSGFTIQGGMFITYNNVYRIYLNGCGGGIGCTAASSPTIMHCIIQNNEVGTYGGGLFAGSGSSPTVYNTLFIENTGNSGGGAVFSKWGNSHSVFVNCNFFSNIPDTLAQVSAQNTVINSIILVDDCDEEISYGTIIEYSFITCGWSGPGNIGPGYDLNKIFVDLANGDMRLVAGSPCIDAGINLTDPPLLPGDLDGNPRRTDDPNTPDKGYGRPPVADMGAYEYRPPAAPNTNNPPQVNAGADKIVKLCDWLDLSDAAASDEQPLSLTWTKTAGPDNGQVLFDPNSQTLHPQVWFSEPNQYTLHLEADDGDLSAADTLAVTVVRVSAGRSQTIQLPQAAHLDASLNGAPPASVNWQVVPQYSDAGDVNFSTYSTTDYDTNASFTQPGTYVLRLTAEFVGFEGIQFTDDVSVNVLPDPANPDNNAAPAVSAYADPNTIIWPVNTTYLSAQVSDDGLPDGRLSVQWKSGYSTTSGTVTFGNYSAAKPDTAVTFSQPGTYQLILSADDGPKQTSRPVLVTVLSANTPQDNQPPQASAGSDQNIHRSPFTPFTITPGSSANDPTPTGYLSIQWTVIEGPQGGLGISDPAVAQPQITFFQTGTWTLLLTVSDGQYTATDQAAITVTTDPLESAFEITAGEDKTITLPAFAQMEDAAVTVTDSNDPYPLDGLLIEWSKVSGPGDIEFFVEDPNQTAPHTELHPSLRFSKAGTYTLQLVVSDPDCVLLDEVQIIVNTGRRIATHVFGSYVIDDYDTAWSAGANHYGQLGNGSHESEYQFYFSKVLSGAQGEHPYLNHIDSIAAGWIHSLALDKDRNLWAFGAGNAGSLGTGEEENYWAPVRVHTGRQQSESGYLENIVSIGAGCAHSLAVDADGFVWAWGYNNAGQLGNSQYTRLFAPYNQYFDILNCYYQCAWEVHSEDTPPDRIETSPVLIGSPCTELDVYYTFELTNNEFSPPDIFDRIDDSSGNHRHAYSDQYCNYIDGVSGNAISFNGVDNLVLGSLLFTDPNYCGVNGNRSRTVSLWINRIYGWNYPTGTLVAWGSDDQDGAAWEIKCIDGILGVYVSAGNFDHKIQTVDPIEDDDNWHHVVILLPEGKTTLQDIEIWTGLEGQPIEQQDTICPVQNPLEIQTDSELYAMIGDTYFDPELFPDPDGLSYHGLLDELQIYNRGLSEWEINYLHSDPNYTAPLRNICETDGGWSHSVVLEQLKENDPDLKGRVYTFGSDFFYALGIGETESSDFIRPLPVCVKGGQQGTEYLQDILQISAGWNHCLALEKLDENTETDHKGRVYAWGNNNNGTEFWRGEVPAGYFEVWVCAGGRVGREPNSYSAEWFYMEEPVLIYGPDLNQNGIHDPAEGCLENIVNVSAGESHSLALDKDGRVWAWGSNFFGQLGSNEIPLYQIETISVYPGRLVHEELSTACCFPQQVVGPDLNGDGLPDGYLGDQCPIVAIKAGPWHSLAMDAEGNVWAWGAPWAIGVGQWEILYSDPFTNFAFYPQPVKWQGGRVKRYSQGVLVGTYDAIQPAVDDATPNSIDEIVAYPGLYMEHVVLGNKNIILRSVDPNNPRIVESTIIDGRDIERYIENNPSYPRIDTAVLIEKGVEEPIGAQITIGGFTICNAQYGVKVASYDPDMIVVISNNRIQNTATGILSDYDGFSTNQIQLIVRDNIVENSANAGITISSIDSAVLENNIIRSNGDGSYIGADQVLIKNNLICENGFMRNLSPVNCAGVLNIIGNTIANNYNEGFECQVPYSILAFRNNILWGNSDELHPSLCGYEFNCIEENDPGDPNFANLYDFWAITQNDGSTSMLSMSTNDISKYNPGDVVEYHFDGIPRVISSVDDMSNRVEIHFSPSMEENSCSGRFVFNWGLPDVFITQTDAAGGDNWMHVADANGFCIGDVIRYDVDNIRIVTGVNADGGIVEFDPTLTGGTASGVQVINYSAYLDQMNLTHDYHLTNMSHSCLDKGHPCDPNEGDTDIDGGARKLNGNSDEFSYIDIGADEYSPYIVDAGADKEIQFGQVANMEDAEVLPDGCTFQWVLLSAPAGSAYPLNQTLTTYLNPIFELDALGQYLFKLSAYEGENLVGSDTVTVLVGMSVDADTAAPYESTLVYDPSSGLCSASVELVGQVCGADPEDIQILWGDPDYAVSQGPVLWEQGDSLYTAKDITFYRSGTYVIPLEVFDLWGRLLASDTAVVTIHAPAFEVDAGPARQIDWTDPSVTIQLCGKVIGYPVEQVDLHWRQISGPRVVVFDPNLPGDIPRSGIIDPNVTFSLPGLYEFQFVADHGLERRVDNLQILVGRGVLLSAGADLYGELIDGQAVVTTDAYVYPNDGSLTIQWYCDGQIVNGATWPSGTFRFNSAGNYELTLHVSDAQQTWTDSILVHIYQLPSGDPGQSLYINPGTYEPVVLENGYACLWLKDAFYHAQTGQVLSSRWSLSEGPDYVEFVQSPDGGQTSTILNPDVIFTEDDTYWLKLEVLDSQDTVVGFAETCVVVLPEDTPPPTSGPDQTSPSVYLSAAQDGEDIANRTLTHGRVEITARAIDSGSGLQILQLVLVNEEEEEEFLTEVFDQIHFPANLDLRHTLEVVGLSPGQYKLKAQAWDRIPNYGFAELVFDVNVPSTGQPPIAAILNLDPNLIEEGTAYKYKKLPVLETGFFELHGLAWHPQISDQNVRYKLDLYGQSGQTNSSNDWNYVGPVRIVDKAWQVDGFYHGQVRPDPNCFGQIDLTGFENGVYQLMLTVQVPGPYGDWLSSYADAQFVLDCPLKIGQVKFTQEDLVIPVGGLPLRILRTYNSFQRHQDGPFGHGWTYTIAGMDIELNEQRIPMPVYPDGYEIYSIRVSDNFDRNVTLTLPDGRKATFQFYLEYDPGYMGQLGYYVAKYQSPPGVTDTLETYPQERFEVGVSGDGFGGLWNGQGRDLNAMQDPRMYDFSGYILTAEDGTQYFFDRQDYGFSGGGAIFGTDDIYQTYFVNPRGDLYLSKIQSPTGEIIDFNINSYNCQIGPKGIEHQFPGGAVTKAIKIIYDTKQRISEIYAPAEQGVAIPTIYYEYDNFDNLAKVHKLVDKTKTDPNQRYETLTYLYEDEDQGCIPADHYITGIQDPRGIQPIRYLYDDAGRLIATKDANGNTIQLGHDGSIGDNRYEEVTDRSGNTSRYFYNLRGNVTLVQKFDSENVVIDYTKYSYDEDSPFGPDRPLTVASPHRLVGSEIEESVTRYHYEYQDNPEEDGYGQLWIETVIDPNNNLTRTFYDEKGNVTQVVQGKNAEDFDTFEELTASRTYYDTDTNLPYLTGITTGSGQDQVWHTLSVTWYDTLNRITRTAQINTDQVGIDDLLDGGNLKPFDTAMQTLLASSPVTSYVYDEEWSGSPDQPYSIVDPAGGQQHFHYDQNNAQDASWTLWDDPADPDADPDKFVMNLAVTDDQGRPLQSYRLTDEVADPEHPDPNVVNIYTGLSGLITAGKAVLQSTTIYNSIGQADRTIDAHGITTQYEYDALGQLVQTLVYESQDAWQAHYPGFPADTAGLLSISQTLYDADGRAVVSVGPRDPNNPILPTGTETVYDPLGRVTQTRRWAQVQITMSNLSDTYGNLVGRKATGWTTEGAAPAEGNELSHTRTEYDIAGRVWRTYTQNEEGEEICTAEFEYDPSGRQIRTISLPGTEDQTVTETLYDGTQRTAVIDARNNRTEFGYDLMGRLHRIKSPQVDYIDNSQTPQTGPLYTHTGYDGLGNKAWTSQPVPQDLAENVSEDDITMYVYSPSGRLEQVSLPSVLIPAGETGAGYTFNPLYTYYYDSFGNQIAILDPKGRATVFEYDHLQRLKKKYMPFKTTYEPTVNEDNPSFSDIAGQLAGADPNWEEKWYDSLGRIEIEKDYKGQYTCYYYYDQNTCRDGSGFSGRPGQLWAKYYYAEDYNNPANLRSTILYAYDHLGRLHSETMTDFDQSGQEIAGSTCNWTYQYDVQGRLVQIDSPQGTLSYAYDPITGRKTTTSTDATQTDYLYDDLGRLSQVNLVKRDGVAASESTTYGYNEVGSRESVALPNGAYTWYNYNALNQLTDLKNFDEYEPNPQNPTVANVLSGFAYTIKANGMRNGVSETFAGEETRHLRYGYDPLNRLEQEKSYNNANLDPQTQGVYGYTADYKYDLVGNRLSRDVAVKRLNQGTPETVGLYTQYQYDQDTDRLIKEINYNPFAALPWDQNQRIYAYADGSGGFAYRLPGSDKHIGQTMAFVLGLPSAWSGWILITLLVLVPIVFFFPWLTLSFPRRRESRTGDKSEDEVRQQIARLSLWKRGLCVLFAYIFLIGPDCFQMLSHASVQYSDLSTASWGAADDVFSYWYDANGSLIYKIHANVSGIEDMTLAQVQAYLSNNPTTGYDHSVYNLRNRLIKLTQYRYEASQEVEIITECAYSPSGFRVSAWTYTVINGDTEDIQDETLTQYLADPANHTGYTQVFEENVIAFDNTTHNETGRTRIQYTIGDDIISENKSTSTDGGVNWTAGTTQYLLYDGHGSTRQLLNHGGTVQDSYSYDGYGVLLQSTSAEPGITPPQDTSLLYAGEMFDFASQHYYNRARWYNPLNGRFNRVDPFSGNLSDPQSLHKYAYCHNNPINGIDPTGEGIILQLKIPLIIRGIITAVTFGVISAGFAKAKGATWSQSLWAGLQTMAITGLAFISPLFSWCLLAIAPILLAIGIMSGEITWKDTPELMTYLLASIALLILFKSPSYKIWEVKTTIKIKIPQAINNLNAGNTTTPSTASTWKRAVANGDKAAQGTCIHKELADIMRNEGFSNLGVEVSYNSAGNVVPYGTKGSIRLDYSVFHNDQIIKVFDLKPVDVISGSWLKQVCQYLKLTAEDVEAINYRGG